MQKRQRTDAYKSQIATKGLCAAQGLLWQLWQLAEAGEKSLEFLISLAQVLNEACP